MRRTSRRALLSTLILASASHAARAEPVAVRDQNPLLRGQYLPVAASSGRPDGRLAHHVLLTLSNTTNLETRGGESLRIDGEAVELRWLATWQPARRVLMRFTLPVVHYSGGALDGAIDEWHDLFGLPRGQRPRGAKGELDYRYSSAAGTVQETQDHSALGDGAVEAGYLLAATDRAFVSMWLGVELPTGSSSQLTGNEAWDAATWVEAGTSSTKWRFDGRMGLVRPGAASPLPLEPNPWVAFGGFGTTWNPWPAFGLSLQVDAHDSMFDDTGLRFLGPALQLTIGAQYRAPAGWRLQFAVAEDLRADASPDVAIHLGVRLGGTP